MPWQASPDIKSKDPSVKYIGILASACFSLVATRLKCITQDDSKETRATFGTKYCIILYYANMMSSEKAITVAEVEPLVKDFASRWKATIELMHGLQLRG
ncbi:hypothetical protein Tco_0127746 [Tanacetum coccineum]